MSPVHQSEHQFSTRPAEDSTRNNRHISSEPDPAMPVAQSELMPHGKVAVCRPGRSAAGTFGSCHGWHLVGCHSAWLARGLGVRPAGYRLGEHTQPPRTAGPGVERCGRRPLRPRRVGWRLPERSLVLEPSGLLEGRLKGSRTARRTIGRSLPPMAPPLCGVASVLSGAMPRTASTSTGAGPEAPASSLWFARGPHR